MTLLSNISILVLILAVIAVSMLYARLLKRCMKEIEEREKEIAGLVDKIRAMQVAGNKTSTTPKKTRKTSTGK